MIALHLYIWIAAIGFPISLPWALLKKRDMDYNYQTGRDDGWSECWDFLNQEYLDENKESK